jgi:phosphonoacetaldehyde hydrolase
MDYRYERRYTGPVRALICDLAGTAVDYGSCAPAGAFVELFRRRGIGITFEQARAPMGLAKRDHIRVIANMPSVAAKWRELNGQPGTEADIDKMYEEFIPLQLEVLPRFSGLIPGLLDTVAKLSEMKVAVAANTGYNREMMDTALAEANRQGFVPEVSVCATEVKAGRPAPWLIFRTMELLGVYPPEAVAVIGDTVPDVEAGLNAGVWTIAVARTGNMLGLDEHQIAALPPTELQQRLASAYDQLYRAGAHFVIDGIADCVPVIEEINRRNPN